MSTQLSSLELSFTTLEHFVSFMCPPLREGEVANNIEIEWLSQTAWSAPSDVDFLKGIDPETDFILWEVSLARDRNIQGPHLVFLQISLIQLLND